MSIWIKVVEKFIDNDASIDPRLMCVVEKLANHNRLGSYIRYDVASGSLKRFLKTMVHRGGLRNLDTRISGLAARQ
jgi:hypothetical protein